MSLHLNFEPHSWYMGFAIGKYGEHTPDAKLDIPYFAVTDNGNTYQVDTVEGRTLKEVQENIRQYHLRKFNGYGEHIAKKRLETLRDYIQNEGISYGQIAELQSLSKYIQPGDVQLLEWAGVPERTV